MTITVCEELILWTFLRNHRYIRGSRKVFKDYLSEVTMTCE